MEAGIQVLPSSEGLVELYVNLPGHCHLSNNLVLWEGVPSQGPCAL